MTSESSRPCHPRCAGSANLLAPCRCACRRAGHGSHALARMTDWQRRRAVAAAKAELEREKRMLDLAARVARLVAGSGKPAVARFGLPLRGGVRRSA